VTIRPTDLRDRFTGDLWLRGDDEFEEASAGRVFNARRPDRRPAAVLHAATYDDVVAGVRLAREQGWQVAPRSGGHSWAAWGLREGSLLLDVHRLKTIELDAQTGVAIVDSGVKGGEELAPFLAERGRMFHGGHCPTVGVAGFLLQGGQGWCARGWGWAAEAIVAIDVVTADGELVRADAEQNSDLYWAARGAGPGFFGVVTRFHLQTRPKPREIRQTVYAWPVDEFDDVMRWLYAVHATADPEIEIVALSLTPPPETGITDHEHVLLVNALAFKDSPEEAERALAPFDACPLADRALVRARHVPTTLAEQYGEQYRQNPKGRRWTVDNAWLDADPDTAIPLLRDAFTTWPTRDSFTLWYSMAPLRPLPDMAFSLQTEVYLATYTVSVSDDDDPVRRAWVDDQMGRLEPITAGQYLGDSDLSHRQVKFLSDDNFARLQTIRANRDPDGLFVSYLTVDPNTLNTNAWLPEGAS
jgi:FAD/FMN-containing dehydrogenase